MYKLSLIYLVKEQSGCENQKEVHSVNELFSDVIDTSYLYPKKLVELCGIERGGLPSLTKVCGTAAL